MSDVLWSDVSEFQVGVDDSYPYQVLAIRANDGTYRDHKFAANYAWARAALDAGKLAALIIYLVYRPNWSATLATVKDLVGAPHPRAAFMLDVESWNGEITGDNSHAINCLYWGLADWVGSARVIGYGNAGDLNALWPTKPTGTRLILAAYGSNPDYPGKLGHQFTDGSVGGPLLVPPFGAADVDSADGYDLTTFCAALGLGDDSDMPLQTDERDALYDIREQLTGSRSSAPPQYAGWPAKADLSSVPKTLLDYIRAVHAELAALHEVVGALRGDVAKLSAGSTSA